jgi:hypothetical protein
MLGYAAHIVIGGLVDLVGLVLFALAWVEQNLRDLMTAAGVPLNLQMLLEIVVAVLFLAACVRLFSGFIRVAAVVVLLAIIVQAVTHQAPPPLPRTSSG